MLGTLGGLIVEIFVNLCIWFARALSIAWQAVTGRRIGLVAPPDRLGEHAVLVLHGLNLDDWLFWPMRRRLRKAGFGPVYLYNFGPLRWTLEENAEMLARDLAQLHAQHGAVHLVAHSMGGMIARYCIQRLGCAPYVRSLTTLATPHFGTPMARLGVSRPAKQLKPDAEFVRDLNDPSRPFPKSIPTLFLWTHLDLIVPGKWGGKVGEGPHAIPDDSFVFVPFHGHSSIFLTGAAFNPVCEHLQRLAGLTSPKAVG